MVLGNVVDLVGGPWPPEVSELRLGGMAAEPVESHVHQFKTLAGNVVGHHPERGRVIRLHWHWRLFVVHFVQGIVRRDCFMAVNEEGTKFGFGCTGHDGLENFGYVEDGSIVGWVVNVSRAEEMTINKAAG